VHREEKGERADGEQAHGPQQLEEASPAMPNPISARPAPAPTTSAPPVPGELKPSEVLNGFRRDPLGLFVRAAALPLGMARTRFLGRELIIVTHPDHVHHVVAANHQNYDKNAPMYTNAEKFLGKGLIVMRGGEDWMRRRRLMQPAFHRRHVSMVSDAAERYLADVVAEWDRVAASGEPLDVSLEMTRLTMRIICRVLFGVDVTGESADFARRLEEITLFVAGFLSRPFPPLSVPTRSHRRFHANVASINGFVSRLVRTRQADPERHDDLLDLLIDALGDESAGALSRQQLQDELIGFFFSGHDTLAHTLAWCWYLLAGDPRADAELAAELAAVLGGRAATLEDVPNLPYTQMVVDEAMRLYPVVWINMRRALGEDVIGGHRIPAGAIVAWSPYAGNRFAEVWDDPDRFRPERFAPEQCAQRERHAVSPFGEGPRVCIGSGFATVEAVMILATLAQRHQVRLVSDEPAVPGLGFTLYPKDGLWATLIPRGAAESRDTAA
jgi:cytochrome P450